MTAELFRKTSARNTALAARVEELEREADDLRRENGWLKEIVALKSKRTTGTLPELAPSSSGGASGSGARYASSGEGDGGGAGAGAGGRGGASSVGSSQEEWTDDEQSQTTAGKGKGRARS